MCKKFEVFSDEKLLALQKRVASNLKLTPDNVQQKILEMPIIYIKYKKLYLEQRGILKNINTTIKQTRAKRYKYYKFGDYEYHLDNTTEVNMFVDGDDEICELNILYDRQEGIVEYLKDVISMISKLSFQIRNYVDMEKLRNGV